MGKGSTAIGNNTLKAPELKELLARYGCGPVQLSGTDNSLYERHLVFDNVVDAGEPAFGRGLKHLPARFATSFRNAGYRRKTHTNVRIRSESTTFRWNSSLVAHWLTMSPTCCSIRSEASDSAKRHRLASSVGTGARRRTGEWGAWTPGGLFPRLLGNHAVASHGLWFAL